MNKRQRKKHRVGEFVHFGFEVRFDIGEPTEEDADKFWDSLLSMVESNDLICGGGNISLFVERCQCRKCRRERRRTMGTTENDRAMFTQWLSQQTQVTNFVVGHLVDVNTPDTNFFSGI